MPKRMVLIFLTWNTHRNTGRQSFQTGPLASALRVEKLGEQRVNLSAIGFVLWDEDYFYSNLSANVGLEDIDFDTENPNYGY